MNEPSLISEEQLSEQLAASKQALRQEVLAIRDAMAPDERNEAALEARIWALWAIGIFCHSSLGLRSLTSVGLPKGQKPPVIGLFWPIRSEIDCLTMQPALRRAGLDLALPYVLSETELEFRLWQEETPLVKAGFGTRAPDEKAPAVFPDLILVPLVGFDRQRNRLGYGAGFYDRYIAKLSALGRHPTLYGYAYGCQKLDKVPVGRYDLPLDCIVTDEGLV